MRKLSFKIETCSMWERVKWTAIRQTNKSFTVKKLFGLHHSKIVVIVGMVLDYVWQMLKAGASVSYGYSVNLNLSVPVDAFQHISAVDVFLKTIFANREIEHHEQFLHLPECF